MFMIRTKNNSWIWPIMSPNLDPSRISGTMVCISISREAYDMVFTHKNRSRRHKLQNWKQWRCKNSHSWLASCGETTHSSSGLSFTILSSPFPHLAHPCLFLCEHLNIKHRADIGRQKQPHKSIATTQIYVHQTRRRQQRLELPL